MLFLAASACTAVFASIPYGWNGLLLTAVTTLGIEILTALLVPDMTAFRASVDEERSRQFRMERQNRLLEELDQRGDSRALETFVHMRSRVDSLYKTAGDASTTLTKGDVDKLADLTVDYLNLCMVNLSLKERRSQVSDEDIRKRISALQTQLKSPSLAADEAHQIQKALAEYIDAGNRSRRLEVRRSTLEATLVSLPDKLEEVYQLVMAAPFSTDMGNKIEESLSRLRIAEEVSAEFDSAEIFNLEQTPAVLSSNVSLLDGARRAARSVKN